MENEWRLLYLKAKCNKEEGLVSLSYECKKSVCIFKRIYVNLLGGLADANSIFYLLILRRSNIYAYKLYF